MKGTIRPTGRKSTCPKCNEKFQHIPKIGFICLDCKTTPEKYLIDLHWSGKRCRICSDKQGQALDSYQRAANLQAHLQGEIEDKTFDPSKYVKSELKEYYATNLLDKFLMTKKKSIAPSYIDNYSKAISRAKDFWGNTDVREIRKYNNIQYKEWLEGQETKREEKLSPKTVKNILDIFKTFMHWLMDDLELLTMVPPFPTVDVDDYNWTWCSSEDQINILDKIDAGDRPIFAFLMLHGIRPGEARALKVKHVDIKRESILINSTFSGTAIREKRKGKKSRAVEIPIHPEMVDYLEERTSNLPEAFIFNNPRTGGYYSATSLRRVWLKAIDKAGVSKSIRLYDATRHSVASQLANQNVSQFQISKLLGHTTTKTTEKYMHKNLDAMRVAVSNLSLKNDSKKISRIDSHRQQPPSTDRQQTK